MPNRQPQKSKRRSMEKNLLISVTENLAYPKTFPAPLAISEIDLTFSKNNSSLPQDLHLWVGDLLFKRSQPFWTEAFQDWLEQHQIPSSPQESLVFLEKLTQYLSQKLGMEDPISKEFQDNFSSVLKGKKTISRQESNLGETAKLQDLLRQWGYTIDDQQGKYRGIFGPQTERAVKSFQKNTGLFVDGIVGTKTLSALLKNMAVKLPEGIGLKSGAVIHSLHPKMAETFTHIEAVWKQLTEVKPVITSGNDSIHHPNSKHYQNLALDLRGKNVSAVKLREIGKALQKSLGEDYLVFAEVFPENPGNNHIHIQYNGS